MPSENRSPPPHWGDDKLTSFLDSMRGNQFATFANKKIVADLISIDQCFRDFLENAINLRPWMPANFMLRSHSSYLAACSSVMAGDVYNSTAPLRNSLESAAYGLYIGDNATRAEIWLSRHENDASLRRAKSEFTIAHMKTEISARAPTLRDKFDRLYELCIDFGGHPNERGFSSNMQIRNEADRTHFLTVYLNEDNNALNFGLKTAVQVGLWSLFCFRLLYPERFELLGISEHIDQLKLSY